MTDDAYTLYQIMLDKSAKADREKIVLEIGRIDEIVNAENKIERLLGELKKDKLITSYLRNEDGEVIIELGLNNRRVYEHNISPKVADNEIYSL